MPEELQAEPFTEVGVRDQTRDIGHGEPVVPAVTTPRFGTNVVNG